LTKHSTFLLESPLKGKAMNIALGDEPKNNDFEGNENFMAFDAFVANDK
jgi:hypothetical protein